LVVDIVIDGHRLDANTILFRQFDSTTCDAAIEWCFQGNTIAFALAELTIADVETCTRPSCYTGVEPY